MISGSSEWPFRQVSSQYIYLELLIYLTGETTNLASDNQISRHRSGFKLKIISRFSENEVASATGCNIDLLYPVTVLFRPPHVDRIHAKGDASSDNALAAFHCVGDNSERSW